MSYDISDYESDNCFVDYLGDLSGEQAEKLIGRTIIRVENKEYSLTLFLDNGDQLYIAGTTYGDCPLEVELIDKENI